MLECQVKPKPTGNPGYLLRYLSVTKNSRSYGYAHFLCLDLPQNLHRLTRHLNVDMTLAHN